MKETHDLERLIPHRKPMLLLDAIVSLGDDEIVAEKRIHPDAFFLQGHYPDYPIVPGVITCECLFQAGAALLARRLSIGTAVTDKVPVVARIGNAKFRFPIRPGDHVFYVVRFKEQLANLYLLSGEARVGDDVAARVEFACAMAPRRR